jgi:hypothetical protein
MKNNAFRTWRSVLNKSIFSFTCYVGEYFSMKVGSSSLHILQYCCGFDTKMLSFGAHTFSSILLLSV